MTEYLDPCESLQPTSQPDSRHRPLILRVDSGTSRFPQTPALRWTRRLAALGAATLLACLGPLACGPAAVDQAPTGETAEEPEPETAETDSGAADLAYRDAVSGPPPGWSGPVFELSHDYPTTDPGACPPETCPWLAMDVDFSDPSPTWGPPWSDYLQAIFDYVKEGQDLSPEGWNTAVGGETRWYHVPWMAYDPKVGREFVHGFTNERTAYLSDFLGSGEGAFGAHTLPLAEGGSTEEEFESWAVGFYNPWGGHAIGGTWGRDGEPVMSGNPAQPAGLPFPEGTVVAKILFTAATPDDVYYLEGSPEWTADRHTQVGGCEREPQPVRLVQMDVAVVDERAPTRWVYGTFGYDGTLEGSSPWDRMAPLGLQWGNDPESFPAVAEAESRPVHQSVLAPVDIYEHFGCNARLAGPVDNKKSACLACHGGGYVARPAGSISEMAPPCEPGSGEPCNHVPQIFGFDGLCTEASPENANYFANVTYPEPYTGDGYPNTFSTDTSLQLQVAFMQYGVYNTNGQPNACTPAG
ncbi:MAG: hypothetical protein ACOC7L_01500 [Acidobacteriota bacterium]